ncbi:cell division protein FtsL [Amylibacter sp.]|nr:cell division protein FtsL [Amylibacter sp.]MDB4248920.1 cell division protein FtsL [Amylibacter sp.]
MRIFIYIVCSFIVITMAYWAYTENYTTQASIRRVEELNRLVADEKEAISILNAEWAYLNRPERLSNLADLNFIKLKLVPLAAQHFTELEVIPMPPRRSLVVSSPVLVSSDGGKQFP